ncbi:MAG: hypothetical protein M3017_06125 [Actinomycetota bacterium]|nr:hypothetical protein [Actinomycetota bacterium]
MTEQEPSNRSVDAAEGDYLEQQLPVNPAEDADPDPEANESDPAGIQDVDANEADVLEQRREVPDDDDYQNSASSGREAGY